LADEALVVGESNESPVVARVCIGEAEPRLQPEWAGDDTDDEDEGGGKEKRRCNLLPGLPALRNQPLTAPAVIPATKYSTKKE
jgi:hypothetical protein